MGLGLAGAGLGYGYGAFGDDYYGGDYGPAGYGYAPAGYGSGYAPAGHGTDVGTAGTDATSSDGSVSYCIQRFRHTISAPEPTSATTAAGIAARNLDGTF